MTWFDQSGSLSLALVPSLCFSYGQVWSQDSPFAICKQLVRVTSKTHGQAYKLLLYMYRAWWKYQRCHIRQCLRLHAKCSTSVTYAYRLAWDIIRKWATIFPLGYEHMENMYFCLIKIAMSEFFHLIWVLSDKKSNKYLG